MIGRKAQPSAQDDDKPLGFDDYDLRLGDIMRGERATIGKSLLDVQRELKIRASYIAAIENCDVGAFETQGFVAGYVRSYARYLGMDPEWAYAKFCDEADFSVTDGMSASSGQKPAVKQTPGTEYRDPLANPSINLAPEPEPLLGRVDPAALGSIAVLIALIAGIGFGGWSVLQEIQRVQLAPVDRVPEVADDLDPVPAPESAGEADDNGEGTRVAGTSGVAFDRLYRPQALETPVMTSRDGPIAAIKPGEAGVLVEDTPDLRPDAIRMVGEADVPETPAEPAGQMQTATLDDAPDDDVKVVEEPEPSVEILAVRPAWVRVRASDGTVLLEKTLESGERYEVPQTEEPAQLRAGNSGAVYFVIDGETYGPSAPGAQIAKNVALSASALSESYALADLNEDPDLRRMIAVADASEE